MSVANGKAAAIGFIPLLLVAGIFGAYVFLATSSSPAFPTTVISNISGLELRVALNSTHLNVGQNLSMSLSLFNTLSTQNNVTLPYIVPNSSQLLIPLGFPIALWGGCLNEPIYFMIVKGIYSAGELHDMSTNSSPPSIACSAGGRVASLQFQSNSDVALVNAFLCITSCRQDQFLSQLESNFTVNGYWALPLNASEASDILTPGTPCTINGVATRCVTFNYPEVGPIAQALFSPGKYTLAVSDLWGQVDILYFTVS